MEPSFADGDLVLIEPVGVRRFGVKHKTDPEPSASTHDMFGSGVRISEGDVVIARHPFKKLDIIKFVSEIHEDNHLTVRSPSGDDSRQFGRVPFSTVKGRVTANLTQRMVIRASGDD